MSLFAPRRAAISAFSTLAAAFFCFAIVGVATPDRARADSACTSNGTAVACSGDTTTGLSVDGSGAAGSNGSETAGVEKDSAGNGTAGVGVTIDTFNNPSIASGTNTGISGVS